MSKVLFIPALFYLSNKLFFSIADHLKGVDLFFLDCDYKLNSFSSKSYFEDITQVKNYFNHVDTVFDKNVSELYGDDIISKLKVNLNKRNVNLQIIKRISRISPDLIVLTSDQTDTFKLLIHYFKTVPILVIQQGALIGKVSKKMTLRLKLRYSLLRLFFKYPTLEFNPWVTDKNQHSKLYKAYWSEFWLNDNRISEKTFYTGNGTLDEDLEKGNYRLMKQRHSNSGQFTIIYTTQPVGSIHGQEKQNMINKLVLDFTNATPNLNLIIKVHPREGVEYYQTFFRNIRHNNLTITKDGDLKNMLLESDVLLTGWSMTSYQAVALGIPAIALNPDGIFDYSMRFPSKGIEIVSTVEELVDTFNYLISNKGFECFKKDRSAFLKVINTFDDGNSSKRLADLILTLVYQDVQ
jgi:hypothetical protein